MTLDIIIAMLIALLPLVLAIIFTRVYNIIHGIVSYLFFGALLTLCLSIFGNAMPELSATIQTYFGGLYNGVGGFLCNPVFGPITLLSYTLLGAVGLGEMVINNPQVAYYVYFVVIGLVFLVSQILSSVIYRRRRRNKKALIKQAKRY